MGKQAFSSLNCLAEYIVRISAVLIFVPRLGFYRNCRIILLKQRDRKLLTACKDCKAYGYENASCKGYSRAADVCVPDYGRGGAFNAAV